MNNYHCQKFCGNSSDFLCQGCLLQATSSRQLLTELIKRKLVLIQKRPSTDYIEGYFIWESNLKKDDEINQKK